MHSRQHQSLSNIIRNMLVSQEMIFLFIILLIFATVAYSGGERQIESQRSADHLFSQRMGDYIRTAVLGLKTLAALPPLDDANLRVVGETNSYFDALYLIDNTGRLLGIYPPDRQFPVGRDMSTSPFFITSPAGLVFSRPFISPRTGNPTIYISVPGVDHNYLVVGELSLAGLQENLVKSNLSPIGIFYIADQDGYLLAHPSYEKVRQQVDIRPTGILERAAAGQHTQLYLDHGIPKLVIAVKNQDTGYWAIVEATLMEIYGPYIIPSLLGLVLTGVVFSLVFKREQNELMRRVVTPLNALKDDAIRLSSGEFSEGDLAGDAQSYEEVSSLAASFMRMKQAVKSRETALAQERNLLRTIIDNLPDPIFTKDRLGRKTLANPADVASCGKSSESEVLGKTDEFFYPADQIAGMLADDRAVLEDGKVILNLEDHIAGLDGQEIWVTISKLPLRDIHGEITGMVGITHNITDRKIAEENMRRFNVELEQRVRERTAELAAANRELEAFSYSVSHDLRAPLRSIDGFSRILQEDYADRLASEAQGHLERIRAASQQMGVLIDDLLKLSRITRAQLSLAEVDLSTQAREITGQMQANEPGRIVDLSIPDRLVTLADTNLIRIALENLLRNAWKFTAKREKAIIELGSMLDKNPPVFYIRDNGAGFNMEYAEKLFAPFQRLHLASEFDGTGIGLAIVQRIISRHGGRIWADASVNQGATFFFTLPEPVREIDPWGQKQENAMDDLG